MFHNFQGVRRNKKIKQLLIWVLLIILIFWAGSGAWNEYKKNSIIKKTHKEAQLELQTLILRQEELNKKLDLFSTERGVEEELRTKFQIVKPGEKAVIIVDGKSDIEKNENSEGMWSRIKNFLSL